MFNPCLEHCYQKYDKQYSSDCDNNCEFAKAIKTLETIMGSQKFCALCANTKCKDSITTDAVCEPKWNGKTI